MIMDERCIEDIIVAETYTSAQGLQTNQTCIMCRR